MGLTELWQRHLATQRWFGSAGQPTQVRRIRPLVWFTQPDQFPAIRSELAEVRIGAIEQTYHLLVAYAPPGEIEPAIGRTELPKLGRLDFVEATSNPLTLRAWLNAMARPGAPGVNWLQSAPFDPDSAIHMSGGEQSNTTVLVGEASVVKVFRRLQPGINPEPEILAALSGSGLTPALQATWRSQSGDYDLGLVGEQIPLANDAWLLASNACRSGISLAAEFSELGRHLRSLHRALARSFGTRIGSGSEIGANLLQRFTDATAEVPQLATHADAAKAVFGRLADRLVTTQRVHGDFHLGQVLRRQDSPDWVTIDFEGEPGVPLEARRSFDSVWRDVAGLLRSIDYARLFSGGPNEVRSKEWAAQATSAFLAGYGPGDETEMAFCDAYQFDKAVYEVVYETRNRPDWAHIPLRAVQDEARRIRRLAHIDKEYPWHMT